MEGWVREEGGCTIGPLFMLPGRASALRVARELCATADAEDSGGGSKTTWRRGGSTGASSLTSSSDGTLNGGDAEAPLLLSQHQQQEDGGGGEVGGKSAGKALPVEGVPPSPVQERITRVRLGKGLPLALTPQQHLQTFIQGGGGASTNGATSSSSLPTKVANIWGEVMAFLYSSETPRLVGVVEEVVEEEGGSAGGKKAF